METLTEIKFNLPFFKKDKRIHSLFEKHDLFPTMEEINRHLDKHLQEISISGNEVPLSLFAHITSHSLVAINNKIHIIEDLNTFVLSELVDIESHKRMLLENKTLPSSYERLRKKVRTLEPLKTIHEEPRKVMPPA